MRATAQQPKRAPDGAPVHYERHRPEQTTLYGLVRQHAASFVAHTEASTGAELPRFIKDEFDAFLDCGFLRLRCGECGHDKLLAFSCKRRGFCPSCGARRMSQTAAHLVDHVIPHVPVRQWVLSLPIPLRLLLAAQPELVTPVLQVVQRVVMRHQLASAGLQPSADPACSPFRCLLRAFEVPMLCQKEKAHPESAPSNPAREFGMRVFRSRWQLTAWLMLGLFPTMSHAQYGSPESLKAEMDQGADLTFAREAKELGTFSSLANAVFAPADRGTVKRPGLVIMPSCGGVSPHTRFWAEEALRRGYVVLTVDYLRGLQSDCGSPSKLSNGRLVKDALDAVAHLAQLPDVDAQRISVIGFSKGAMMASWVSSSQVAMTLRPGTPAVASAVTAYAFCAFAPTRGRPEGIRIVQPDTDRPLLALLAGKDLETPPASCLELMPKLKANGAPVEWHLYPDVTHAWDARHLDGFSKLDFKNERVTYRYDPVATADAVERVFNFFARHSGNTR